MPLASNQTSAHTGGPFIRLVDGNGVQYTAQSDAGGNWTVPVPAGTYTIYRGPSASGPWTQLATGFVVAADAPGLITAPAVPASGTALTSPSNSHCTLHITASTSTVAVAVAGLTLLTIPASGVGTVRLPAGQQVKLTYTAAPTWVWVAD